MNYKDTILKKYELRIKKAKTIEDGKSDLIITVPITALLDAQAMCAFATGVAVAMSFVADMTSGGKVITKEALGMKFKDWGIEKYYKMVLKTERPK